MTFTEFGEQYKRLAEEFGVQQFGAGRGKLLFKYMEDLPGNWWKGIVDRMILEFNPKFQIAEAARAERNANNDYKRMKKHNREVDENLKKVTPEGFAQAMAKLGACSPTEAFLKLTKKEGA